MCRARRARELNLLSPCLQDQVDPSSEVKFTSIIMLEVYMRQLSKVNAMFPQPGCTTQALFFSLTA
jgi:hypothetical protein